MSSVETQSLLISIPNCEREWAIALSVATCGSEVGVYSPSIHAVAALEKELQVSLLERRNGIFLTEIGQRVLIQAQEMLARAERIRQETSAAIGLETGKIRLGSFPSVSARFLPKFLRQFRQRYPGIEVVLFEGKDDEVREWIQTRAVDVGVVVLPAEGLETVPIAQDEFMAVVAHSHPLAKLSQVALHQLSQEPFIMSKAGCEPLILDLFHKAKVTPKIQFEVIDLRTIFAMVQEGIGVTIAPEMALPSDRSGLHMMSLDPKHLRHLALAVPSFSTATPAVASFLNEAQVWVRSSLQYRHQHNQ